MSSRRDIAPLLRGWAAEDPAEAKGLLAQVGLDATDAEIRAVQSERRARARERARMTARRSKPTE